MLGVADTGLWSAPSLATAAILSPLLSLSPSSAEKVRNRLVNAPLMSLQQQDSRLSVSYFVLIGLLYKAYPGVDSIHYKTKAPPHEGASAFSALVRLSVITAAACPAATTQLSVIRPLGTVHDSAQQQHL